MFLGGDVKPTHLEGTSNLWGLLQSDSLSILLRWQQWEGAGNTFSSGTYQNGGGKEQMHGLKKYILK